MNLWGTEDCIRTVSILRSIECGAENVLSDDVQALGIFIDLRNLLCWRVRF